MPKVWMTWIKLILIANISSQLNCIINDIQLTLMPVAYSSAARSSSTSCTAASSASGAHDGGASRSPRSSLWVALGVAIA